MSARPLSLPSAVVSGAVCGPDGTRATWQLAAEVAVEIGFNGHAWTVMMATPLHLDDLAVGLALSEGILPRDVISPGAITSPTVRVFPEGVAVDLEIAPEMAAQLRRRSLGGVTGCGLCGVENLAQVDRIEVPRVGQDCSSARLVQQAFTALGEAQTLNRATHTVHAAGWVNAEGELALVREDVGRHNALDKLIGALVRGGQDPAAGFVVMTSRCSFELVQKCAVAGVGLLATISAPTAMAVDMARRAGMRLMCRGSDNDLVEVAVGGN